MFDTFTARRPRTNRRPRWLMVGLSILAHAAVVAALVIVPLAAVTTPPVPPEILAFVAPPPPAPPPPPPPPPRATARQSRPRTIAPGTQRFVAPLEAPTGIAPEKPVVGADTPGVLGGVEEGVPGGVVGGMLGGPPSSMPPPPAPPPAPVRVGGAIKAPAIVTKVAPEYPAIARAAQLEGIVVLEASVDETGRVDDVKVLRSAGLLDSAAVDAVKRWRYSPLKLNGTATPFVLTVTLQFHLKSGQVSGAA